MAAVSPQQVASVLRRNAKRRPSKYDFYSDFEDRLDEYCNSTYPDAAKLIDDMKHARQAIHNLEFEEEQAGPKSTMTC
jgi:hypothetical protein